jgi:hypothetical protein
MLDTPLDGGSGWSTGSYAIVPRPASVPASAPDQATAPVSGTNRSVRLETPAPPPPEAPEDEGRTTRRLAIAGLVLLILALAAGLYAIWPAAQTEPTAGEQQLGAPGATAQLGTPEATATTAAPTPTGPSVIVTPSLAAGLHRSGTVRMGVVAGRDEPGFDLDAGSAIANSAPDADVVAGAVGLKAANSAKFAAWAQPGEPTVEGCAALPEDRWTTSIVLAALLPNISTCVRTSAGRSGAFVVRQPQALVDGFVYSVYLDYTVWAA